MPVRLSDHLITGCVPPIYRNALPDELAVTFSPIQVLPPRSSQTHRFYAAYMSGKQPRSAYPSPTGADSIPMLEDEYFTSLASSSRCSSLTPLPVSPRDLQSTSVGIAGQISECALINSGPAAVHERRTGRVRKAKEFFDPSDEVRASKPVTERPPRHVPIDAEPEAVIKRKGSAQPGRDGAGKRRAKTGEAVRQEPGLAQSFGLGPQREIELEMLEEITAVRPSPAVSNDARNVKGEEREPHGPSRRKRRAAAFVAVKISHDLLDSILSFHEGSIVGDETMEAIAGEDRTTGEEWPVTEDEPGATVRVKQEEQTTGTRAKKRTRRKLDPSFVPQATCPSLGHVACIRPGCIPSSTFAKAVRLVAGLPPASRRRPSPRIAGPIPRPPVWAEVRRRGGTARHG